MKTEVKVPAIRFEGFSGEWIEKEFEHDLVSVQTGTNLLGAPKNSGRPLIKMGNIQRGYFSFEKVERLEESVEVEKENIAHYGDFLFNTRNTLELVGKGATWMGKSNEFAFNNNIARFTLNGINTIFFNYLYNTQSMIKQVQARAMGTTSVAAIYPQNLKSIDYSLPVTEEQTKIGNYFQQLDTLIAQHQQKHDKLLNLKQALLEKMFPKQGSTEPEIRFKGFDGEWEENPLHQIVDVRSGRDYKHLLTGDIPVFGTGGYMLSVNEALSYNEDAIGIGRKGTIDKPYILKSPFWTVDTLFYAVPCEDNNLNFVYAVFQKINWRQKDESTGVPSLSKVAINNIPVFTSEETEQTKIGNFFQQFDSLISQHQAQLTKLNNIKQACLSKMFV